MTFKNWLINCSDYSKYGWLSVDTENDKSFPDTNNYLEISNYLVEKNAGEMSKTLFNQAYEEYSS
ncbi:YozE family protein [Lysinibacillus fusiformis]|uniref:YozE family protein n=1 Tax=Lysinibacillus fusiformis TaxID=28031 RepID=UPI00301B4A53